MGEEKRARKDGRRKNKVSATVLKKFIPRSDSERKILIGQNLAQGVLASGPCILNNTNAKWRRQENVY
jgi:hypothetical protein